MSRPSFRSVDGMNEENVRVCLLSSFPPTRGGVADYTERLASNLIERSVDVHVLTYGPERSVDESEPAVVGLSKRSVALPWSIGRYIDEIDPDIVHVQSSLFLHPRRFFSFPLFTSSDAAIVTTAHEVPSWRQFHMLPFQRFLYKRSRRCIVHTSRTGAELVGHHGVPRNQVVRIPFGASVDQFTFWPPATDGKHRILFFGFLRPGKGVAVLLDAFERLKAAGSDAELVLAGGLPSTAHRFALGFRSTTDYATAIRRRVANSPWKDSIELTGYVAADDIPAVIDDASVVVFPYERSTQSSALHLALAAGRPIVAHAVGGFVETLADGKTGILYEPNTAARLAETLDTILDDDALRVRLARNARRKAETISWPQIAERTAELYRTVLGDEP